MATERVWYYDLSDLKVGKKTPLTLPHALNHGLFKGLLFQGAVVHATGSRDVESQGGLLRRMPMTGAVFSWAPSPYRVCPH